MSNARNIASGAKFVETAGDTMTGNLGIHEASPSGSLHVKGTSSTHGKIILEAGGSGGSANNNFMEFNKHDGTKLGELEVGESVTNGGSLVFKTTPSGGSATTRMTVNHDGIVTKPNQPAFAVHTVPIGFTTGQVLNWQTEETDIGNNFNMSNDRFVAPVSGFYSFSLICFTDRTTSTGDVYWDVRKNGASFWRHYIGKDGAANVHVQLQGGTQIYLAANDYVDVYFNASVVNSMPSSGIHNRFSGYLIG